MDLYKHGTGPVLPNQWGQHTFTGLYVYRISSDNGFSFLGGISTTTSTSQFDRYYPWTRGLFVEETVYAITPDTVNSAIIDDLDNTVEALSIQ